VPPAQRGNGQAGAVVGYAASGIEGVLVREVCRL